MSQNPADYSSLITRRTFLGVGAATCGKLLASNSSAAEPASETLYNGIVLPAAWPPRISEIPAHPVIPAYLGSPPSVIPISLGRQLFVDDFLIEHTTLKRSYHSAEYHAVNPVLQPDKPWEAEGSEGPVAMAFSDGVWYDPGERLFKMWYMGGWMRSTCYARSADGIHWQKPELDIRRGTNIVMAEPRDSSTVWLDHEEKDAKRRYKLFRSYSHRGRFVLSAHFSGDGLHWSDVIFRTGSCGDRSTVFWNPFRKKWIYSLRHGWGQPRRRRYWETPDLISGPRWTRIDEPGLWTGADRLDPARPDLKVAPELYNLDCVAYESLLIGLFSIWRGHPANRQKPNDLVVGYSRDGWSWHRPERQPFVPVSETRGQWNYSNIQSAGGCCLVVGDKLYFYVSGRASAVKSNKSGICTTGLAVLRRDGFASMDALNQEATLTTRPVRFQGQFLFVNISSADGSFSAEVLHPNGEVIAPFTRANCVAVRTDRTRHQVTWKGADNLASLSGKPVKIRFHLSNGKLYAFWVSPDTSGASHGYVAAGGPGFTGPMDTVGQGPG